MINHEEIVKYKKIKLNAFTQTEISKNIDLKKTSQNHYDICVSRGPRMRTIGCTEIWLN